MRELSRSQIDLILTFVPATFIIIIDQFTKVFFSKLLVVGESIPVIKNVFHFTLIHNTGIAFGLFKDQGLVFIVIPIFAIALLAFNIYYYRQNNEALSHIYILGFSLILGGAIGNLIDRIRIGYVIDFIDFPHNFWPVYNIADSAITIGAIIIAWKCFKLTHPEKK